MNKESRVARIEQIGGTPEIDDVNDEKGSFGIIQMGRCYLSLLAVDSWTGSLTCPYSGTNTGLLRITSVHMEAKQLHQLLIRKLKFLSSLQLRCNSTDIVLQEPDTAESQYSVSIGSGWMRYRTNAERERQRRLIITTAQTTESCPTELFSSTVRW